MIKLKTAISQSGQSIKVRLALEPARASDMSARRGKRQGVVESWETVSDVAKTDLSISLSCQE